MLFYSQQMTSAPTVLPCLLRTNYSTPTSELKLLCASPSAAPILPLSPVAVEFTGAAMADATLVATVVSFSTEAKYRFVYGSTHTVNN